MMKAAQSLSDVLPRYSRMHHIGSPPGTCGLFRIAIKHFSRFLGHDATVRDLTDDKVSEFAGWRLEEGAAINTVQNNQHKLLALWKWAVLYRIVERPPMIKPVKVPERIPQAWTAEELGKLYRAIDETEGMIGIVPAPLWWGVLHRLLWDTAERKSAILKADWCHIDLTHKRLFVPGENRKGRTRDRSYLLGEDTIQLLEQLPHRHGLVLAWPCAPEKIYPAYKAILSRAGLPFDRHSLFHRMRRSVASHIKAAGGDATAALDHASPQTTRGYLDPRIVPQVNPADILFRPEASAPPDHGGEGSS